MRVTVQIDESRLKKIQELTKQKKVSPAISAALDDYIKKEEKRAFIKSVLDGETDYDLTNEEIEADQYVLPRTLN